VPPDRCGCSGNVALASPSQRRAAAASRMVRQSPGPADFLRGLGLADREAPVIKLQTTACNRSTRVDSPRAHRICPWAHDTRYATVCAYLGPISQTSCSLRAPFGSFGCEQAQHQRFPLVRYAGGATQRGRGPQPAQQREQSVTHGLAEQLSRISGAAVGVRVSPDNVSPDPLPGPDTRSTKARVGLMPIRNSASQALLPIAPVPRWTSVPSSGSDFC
jgi:hypothetical protein